MFEAGKVVGSAIKAARIAAVGGRTVWSTVGTAARVAGVVGVIFDAALLPVDLAVVLISAYDVHKYKTEGESHV